MREADVKRKVVAYLKTVPDLWFAPVVGSRFGKRGVPDLLICYCGLFVGLELKVPGRGASALQIHEGKTICAAGGAWLTTSDLNEVKRFLAEIHDAGHSWGIKEPRHLNG